MSYLNKTRQISNKNISLVTNVIMALGDYLLGRGNFSKEVETHLYFINDLAFINHADLYPITFLKRSILGSLLENDDPEYCYIYSNLCGILIVTAIKKTSMDIWQNTLITEVGIITTKQLMGSPVLGKLSMVLKDASKGKIPKEQAGNILKLMKENEKKILESKFLEEFSKDIELNALREKTYRKE